MAKQLHLFEEPHSPYYKHEPDIVLENCVYKLSSDSTLLRDKTVHFNRPDITLVDITNKEAAFIDTAIPLSPSLHVTIKKKTRIY